jgi:hypothetical protein
VTRDDIIRMAREVGAGEPNDLYGRSDYVVMTQYELERFSALIAAAEREACAAMVENLDVQHPKYIADAIRARGDA